MEEANMTQYANFKQPCFPTPKSQVLRDSKVDDLFVLVCWIVELLLTIYFVFQISGASCCGYAVMGSGMFFDLRLLVSSLRKAFVLPILIRMESSRIWNWSSSGEAKLTASWTLKGKDYLYRLHLWTLTWQAFHHKPPTTSFLIVDCMISPCWSRSLRPTSTLHTSQDRLWLLRVVRIPEGVKEES